MNSTFSNLDYINSRWEYFAYNLHLINKQFSGFSKTIALKNFALYIKLLIYNSFKPDKPAKIRVSNRYKAV